MSIGYIFVVKMYNIAYFGITGMRGHEERGRRRRKCLGPIYNIILVNG